jgi:hypothetical protein
MSDTTPPGPKPPLPILGIIEDQSARPSNLVAVLADLLIEEARRRVLLRDGERAEPPPAEPPRERSRPDQ